MARINTKEIKERAAQMSAAWNEGAAAVDFMGVKRADFDAKRAAAETVENEILDLEAQLRMKKDARDDIYRELQALIVNVGSGVRGDADFGDDSELYGAMGFVRKSERASGLTQKSRTQS